MALRGCISHYYSDSAAQRLLSDVRYTHILAAAGASALMAILWQDLPALFVSRWLSLLLSVQAGLTLIPFLFRRYGSLESARYWLLAYGVLGALGHFTWGCLSLTFIHYMDLWQQTFILLLLFIVISTSLSMLARFLPLFWLHAAMLCLPFLYLVPHWQAFSWQLWFVVGLLSLGIVGLFNRGNIEAQQYLDAQKKDPLTGLLNRKACIDELESRPDALTGMLICRLHNYRSICDTFGNNAGDAALQHCANSLRYISEEQKCLGRVGENEFSLSLSDSNTAIWHTRGRHLLRQIGSQMNWGKHLIALDIAIGLAEMTPNSPRAALRHAQQAAAVRSPTKRINEYHPELGDKLERDASIRSALQSPALYDQLSVHFQLKKSLHGNGHITGAEALLRWCHHELGPIPPAEFIAIAEQSDVIHELGDWVIQQAAICLRELPGEDPFSIAVNVSTSQFTNPRLLASLRSAVATLPAHRKLELEITESLMMLDPTVVNDTLAELASLGVSVALDDFGTGYSSLQYLAELSIDTLKIDRSFVADLSQEKHQAVVKIIIEMAHALGISVVAEGVETAEQLALLSKWQCDQAQGFYIARPVPYNEMLAALG